ncbi:hypothetical protein C7I84_28160 [Mesorhizobium ephedrae]|uniref:OmpA-like domain-containing protein n=2 Tax=Kumtagia ephedrae TaxID=2116701 RepID=A0A2P7RKM4_9HYPH|nr:hypothetical protein C7I84_28160 [Mesorhizobium ephedrae]
MGLIYSDGVRAMPLSDIDVLHALSEPVLQKMDFTVDGLHIRGEAYRKIFELIRDEQILVVVGDNPGLATYDPGSDTLTTQKGDSPPDLFNRSILIHECTHAIRDMEYVKMTAKSNEAAAYLAQATYLALSSAQPTIPAGWGVVEAALKLARSFDLDSAPGARRRIRYEDILSLVKRLNDHPGYHSDSVKMATSNGISAKAPKHLRVETVEETSGRGQHSRSVGYRVPGDVLFGFDSYLIRPGAEQALREAAEFIKQDVPPRSRVYIIGHTDSTGDPSYNNWLSEKRAKAVADWFVKEKLFERAQLSAGGEGASQPVAPNTTEEGRKKNRRVDLMVM